jgi:hypothetical protein
MTFEEDKKNKAWEQLSVLRPMPNGFTERRLSNLKTIIWNNEDFWWDLLLRHGLNDTPLDKLEKDVRDHAIGNFWGMLSEEIWKCKQLGKQWNKAVKS